MASPKKKQRQAAKRKAEKQSSKRLQSVSPIKRLATAPGEVECWATRDFAGYGQMSIFAYKRAAGLIGVACFLVDRGVVGLKDAWTQILTGRGEFQEMLDEQREDKIEIGRMPVEDVRRWVAGGARWANDNGMRLPKEWQRAADLIGGVGDWATADVSAFELEFAGHPDDLRQRLIGQPYDDYVRRTDIAFAFTDDAVYQDQATGEYIDPLLDDADAMQKLPPPIPVEELNVMAERVTPAATALVAETIEWLAGESDKTVPSPELFEAWRSILLARMIASSAMPDAPSDELADFESLLLDDMVVRIASARVEEYDRAVDQALDHAEADASVIPRAVFEHDLTGDPAKKPE